MRARKTNKQGGSPRGLARITRSTVLTVVVTMVLALVANFGVVQSSAATPAAPNPPLPSVEEQCADGLNIALVVDLSGSMVDTPLSQPLTTLKNAASSYVRTFAGTDTSIQIFTFASYSPANNTNNADRPLTPVRDMQGVTTLTNWINGWTADGATNWSAALRDVAAAPTKFDFVIFITDGEPNVDNDTMVANANAVKAQGTRIYVVFVSEGGYTNERGAYIASISGEISGLPAKYGLEKNDYFTTNWNDMTRVIQSLATTAAKCKLYDTESKSVTRTIHYVDADGNTVAPDQVQTVSYDQNTNQATGLVTYTSTNPTYPAADSPTVNGYAPDQPTVPAETVSLSDEPQPSEVKVTYSPNDQTANVVYVDDDNNGSVVQPVAGTRTVLTGKTGTPVGFTEAEAQAGVPENYDFVSVQNVDVFDSNDQGDQTITVHLTHHVSDQPNVTTTRTIDYTGAGDSTPQDVTQPITWTVTKDDVTGVMTYTPNDPEYPQASSPVVPGYHTDTPVVPAAPVEPTTTRPGNDTVTVAYVGDSQKANVVYVDDVTHTAVAPKAGTATQLTGASGDEIAYTETASWAGIPDGYEFSSMDLDGVAWNPATAKYDNDVNTDQTITVHLTHHMTQTQMTSTRTIDYVGAGGATPEDVTQSVTWIVTTDDVTGDATYTTSQAGYPAAPSPTVTGYYPDTEIVPALPVSASTTDIPQSSTVVVTYAPGQRVLVKYVDKETGQEVTPAVGTVTVLSGPSGSAVNFTETDARAGVPTQAGYDFDSWVPVAVFDDDPSVDQTITVSLSHHCTGLPDVTTTRTVDYSGAGVDTPQDVTQEVTWTVVRDEVTGVTTYTPNEPQYDEVTVPVVAGYTADKTVVPAESVGPTTTLPVDETVPVNYTANHKPNPPIVDPTDGSQIAGTSDPGTTITVRNPDGTPLEGCVDVPVDSNGRFSCVPADRPLPGTELTVVAKDPAGTESDPTTVIVGPGPTSSPSQTTSSSPSQTTSASPSQSVTSSSSPTQTTSASPTQTTSSTPSQSPTQTTSSSPSQSPTQTTSSSPSQTTSASPSQSMSPAPTPSIQKANVVLVDDDANGQTLQAKPGATTQVSGPAGSPITYTEATARQSVPNGYVYASMNVPTVFDSNDAADQTITVHVTHHQTETQLTTTRTIQYVGAGELTPDPVVQSIAWTVITDDVTGHAAYSTTSPGYPAAPSPVVNGYYPDVDIVPALQPSNGNAPQSSTVTVTYEAGQVVHVVYVDDATGQVVTPAVGAQTTLTGRSGSPVNFTEANARAGVPTQAGYEFSSWDPVTTFDNVPGDQTITVHLSHHQTVTEITTTRTIDYGGAGENTPPDLVQPIIWTVTTDDVTGQTTYTPQSQGYPAVTPPSVDGFSPDPAVIPAVSVTQTTTLPTSPTVTVTYTPVAHQPGLQTATVVYYDDETGQIIPAAPGGVTQVTGLPGTPITFPMDDARPGIPAGYAYESVEAPQTFDSDDSTNQTVTVHMVHQRTTSETTTSRTIACSAAGTVLPSNIVQTVLWTVTTDLVTGAITYTPQTPGYPEASCPNVPGYTANPSIVPALPLGPTPDMPSSSIVPVTYVKTALSIATGGAAENGNTLALTGLASALLLGGLVTTRKWSQTKI